MGRRVTKAPLRAAEFFAGIGLVRLALERQGWEVVFANDFDPDKAKMYRHAWPTNDHLNVEDIHKLRPTEIPQCELFTASFPCNDLSIAGSWTGLNGSASSAFWGFTKLLKTVKQPPRVVLLENVVGFLIRDEGKDFAAALHELNACGYFVDAFILNARHWTPQSRARLFVVGRKKHGQERRVNPASSSARTPALLRFIDSHPEIEWDLQDLPALPNKKVHITQIVEDLPDDSPEWWSDDRLKRFMRQLSKAHKLVARSMMRAQEYSYATAFRRMRNGHSMAELRTDGIAGCLRTPRGGSARQILFKAGYGRHQVRLLTANECARLQGVRKGEYRMDESLALNQALFGFGDAVCVPVIEWIAKHVLRPSVEEIRASQMSRQMSFIT